MALPGYHIKLKLMKIILITIIVMCSLFAKAQDSSIVTNLSLQARLIEGLAPQMVNPDNDEVFDAFLRFRSKYRATRPSGTTPVSIDTITVSAIVYLYNYTTFNPDGLIYSNLLKSQLTSARSANSNLNRQLNLVDADQTNRAIYTGLLGRKFLLGK